MNPQGNVEVLHHLGNYLVRRQRLNPGQVCVSGWPGRRTDEDPDGPHTKEIASCGPAA
jgi:hypothetical protein